MKLPVPFFADPHRRGGAAIDFNRVDKRVVFDLAEKRECYVCGEGIPDGTLVWFLGDEESYLGRYYPESYGHEECLEASIGICPWINNERHARATEKRLGQPRGLKNEDKPTVWILAASERYEVVRRDRRGLFGQLQEAGLYPGALQGAKYYGYDDAGRVRPVTLTEANRALKDAGYRTLPT
jgi:hypothetical protein